MYKILIVEDDLPMAQAIRQEMKMWGHEAEYVKDFRNVLQEFAGYDPHLVLMDITLPFLMDITGAAKSGKFRMCPSYLFLPPRII